MGALQDPVDEIGVKAFLVTSGVIFTAIVVAHIARLVVEPDKARDPWFLAFTVVSLGLGAWAWRLVLQSRRS